MNAKQLIASVVVLAAAGSAFADVTDTFDDYTNIPSTRSRAEVAIELQQPQGQVVDTEWVDSNTLTAKSIRTREEVRAEVIQYARTHKVNPNYEFGG